jgi:hypothetical protein
MAGTVATSGTVPDHGIAAMRVGGQAVLAGEGSLVLPE